ncbi:hypothetical protein MRX96_044912 [Rhipicephalus microplus]
MYGVMRAEAYLFSKKILAYEEQLRAIEKATANWNKYQFIVISELGLHTSPYVNSAEWSTLFSKYTEGIYKGSDTISHFIHSTSIIKRLFENEYVGKVGLQYLVAWSIYRQLVKFTEPYMFRGDKKVDEIIGHEFMHAFDVSTLEDYWGTEEIRNEYTKRALCLRRSHRSVLSLSGQEEMLNETVDSENLGDLVGTRLAYEAFTSLAEEYKRNLFLTYQSTDSFPHGSSSEHSVQSQFPPELLDGDECVGPACLELSSTLRSKLDFNVDPCYDFYQYVCGKFAPMDTFSEVKLVRWLIAMNLDFYNTTRLEIVDPVQIMVRASLDFGVEVIVAIRFDDRQFHNDKRVVEVRH